MTQKELLDKSISAISLGCDKNRVDLEHMLGKLKDYGFKVLRSNRRFRREDLPCRRKW